MPMLVRIIQANGYIDHGTLLDHPIEDATRVYAESGEPGARLTSEPTEWPVGVWSDERQAVLRCHPSRPQIASGRPLASNQWTAAKLFEHLRLHFADDIHSWEEHDLITSDEVRQLLDHLNEIWLDMAEEETDVGSHEEG